MRNDAFREWLRNIDGRPPRQESDNASRAKRVADDLKVNLDSEYDKDRCESIKDRLPSLLKRNGQPLNKNDISSLKTSISKYVAFRDWEL